MTPKEVWLVPVDEDGRVVTLTPGEWLAAIERGLPQLRRDYLASLPPDERKAVTEAAEDAGIRWDVFMKFYDRATGKENGAARAKDLTREQMARLGFTIELDPPESAT